MQLRALTSAATLGLLTLLAGCDQLAVIGGSSSELEQPDENGSQAGGSGDAPAPAGIDAAIEPSDSDSDVGRPDAAADAATVADAAADAATDAGGVCIHPTVALCDPVSNTGCAPELQMQCAIDLATPLSGYCIFSAPFQPVDVPCLNTGVTESCPASYSCVDTVCRKLCFCDSECAADGLCCNIPIGDLGFSGCGDC